MDSSWYAIDKHGHVALFHTGAGGAIPDGAYSPEAAEMMDDLEMEDVEDVAVLDPEKLPDENGMFIYETGPWDECLADRYHRTKEPANPLHVDQLPPDVRSAIKGVCFQTLDFGKTEVFQPIEVTRCGTWDPAYLSGDGKTVRPVPGREGEYAQHAQMLRRDVGEELHCEEPTQKKRRSGGKKRGKADDRS
jgi:hypothetical protein